MNLSINIGGRQLKLPPGAKMDLVENNPFLQLNDSVTGDYSYPFTVPVAGNEQALDYVHLLQSKAKTNQYPNAIVTDGTEYARGVIKKEQVNGNINRSVTESISLYFLKGISSYFKDVENKTLADCDYGAPEVYPATLFALHSHCNDVVRSGDISKWRYAIFDVYNAQYVPTGTSQTPNPPDWWHFYNYNIVREDQGGIPFFQGSKGDPYFTPFPYLNIVIKACFETFGWTVEGFIFNDDFFKKAVLLQTETVIPGRDFKNGNLVLDLKNFVPAIKIESFLIALKNRMGWWYDIDYVKKHCIIRKINDVFNGANRIDITKNVEPSFTNKIAISSRVFALISGGADAPDKSLWQYHGPVKKVEDLPPAAAGVQHFVYYVASEDYFAICEPNTPFGNDYAWKNLTANDFSYIPADKTDDINTRCQVPVVREERYDTGNGLTMIKPVPEISIADSNGSTDSFYIAIHWGMQQIKPLNYNPTLKNGYASASPFALNGNKLGSISLDYNCDDPYTGTDIGLQPNFWAKFLSRISTSETIEILARFTTAELAAMRWDATYIINNTEYICQIRNRQMPYDGRVKLTLVRV